MLIKYIRNGYWEKIGAIVSPAKNRVGVSLCNPKDRFDKRIAIDKAAGRAMSGGSKVFKVPSRRDIYGLDDYIRREVKAMYTRSEKYYKESEPEYCKSCGCTISHIPYMEFNNKKVCVLCVNLIANDVQNAIDNQDQ